MTHREPYYQDDLPREEVDNYWQYQYAQTAQMPILWYDRASSLKLSADIIYFECNMEATACNIEAMHSERTLALIPVYMMLAGYALECLLKGIYLNFGSLIESEGKLKSWWKSNGHNLNAIADKINNDANREVVRLNEKEQFLLDRLNVYILWAGRYPIPTEYKAKMPVKFQNGSAAPLYMVTNKDKERIDEVFERLISVKNKHL